MGLYWNRLHCDDKWTMSDDSLKKIKTKIIAKQDNYFADLDLDFNPMFNQVEANFDYAIAA